MIINFEIEMKHPGLIFGVIAATVFACGKKTEQHNIVWLIAEDLSPDLGCYGESMVKTPNIDNLAARGIRFDSAFASSPVSSPSRCLMPGIAGF